MISLGMDIGGTGCKCVAFDENGTQLALAYEEYPLDAGTVKLPVSVLTESVLKAIGRCTASLDDPRQVCAISVCSFGESFVAIDRDGQPVDDILLYFGNTGNQAFDDVVKQVGAQTIMQITRVSPDPSYSLAGMLKTLQEAEKPVWKFLFIAGYICFVLSGNPCSDVSLACRSMLYDVEKRDWSKPLLDAAHIAREQMPEVLPSGSVVGRILPELARRLNIPEDVRIVAAGHDQIVNALGAGVMNRGEAVDTSGTCECLTPLFGDLPRELTFTAHNFACVPYLQDTGYVTYAYNVSAGSVVRWYRDAFGDLVKLEAEKQGISVYEALDRNCRKTPSELLLMPFLQGMGGTPDVDPAACGLLAGFSTRTRRPEIYRAILEGVTFEMRYNMELLQQGGVRIQTLKACGGGARSDIWLKIKADILGCEIIPVCAEETGAMGCAILGLCAVTGEKPFQCAKRFHRYRPAVQPDPENQAIYEKKYAAYKAMRALYMDHSVLKYGK